MILWMGLYLPVQAQGVTVCSADVDITSCHFGAHCVNMSNNFTCICREGFVGNSLQCDGESFVITRLDFAYIMISGAHIYLNKKKRMVGSSI